MAWRTVIMCIGNISILNSVYIELLIFIKPPCMWHIPIRVKFQLADPALSRALCNAPHYQLEALRSRDRFKAHLKRVAFQLLKSESKCVVRTLAELYHFSSRLKQKDKERNACCREWLVLSLFKQASVLHRDQRRPDRLGFLTGTAWMILWFSMQCTKRRALTALLGCAQIKHLMLSAKQTILIGYTSSTAEHALASQ